jgi:uncharacterized protein (DUF2132 family)
MQLKAEENPLKASTLLHINSVKDYLMQCHIVFFMTWRDRKLRERVSCFVKQPSREQKFMSYHGKDPGAIHELPDQELGPCERLQRGLVGSASFSVPWEKSAVNMSLHSLPHLYFHTASVPNYKLLWLFWFIHFSMYLDILYPDV